MRSIAHISDLHFGKLDEPVAEALVEDLRKAAPTLLVVSGDFTQRARASQYAQAAAYLKRLPTPQLVVPGNHDVPMYGVVQRFLLPLRNYRRHITTDLWPVYQDEQLFVLGANTARSFTQKSGWFDRKQLETICSQFEKIDKRLTKVLVTHHPFIPPPEKPKWDIIRGAAHALARMESCGLDVVLAGHLHRAYYNDVRSFHATARRSVLSIQAGTATSTRRRHEPNAWNFIELEQDHVTVHVRTWNGKEFSESVVTEFKRNNDQWMRTDAPRVRA